MCQKGEVRIPDLSQRSEVEGGISEVGFFGRRFCDFGKEEKGDGLPGCEQPSQL